MGFFRAARLIFVAEKGDYEAPHMVPRFSASVRFTVEHFVAGDLVE